MSEPEPNQPTQGAPASVSHPQLRTAAIGFTAGLLNGLLGIGGGIVLVPGMILLRNATPRVAVSTSLGTVLCLAAVALAVHVAISGLYFSLLGSVLVLVTGVVGSQLGSYLLNRIPQRYILYLFATFTFVASTHLILQGLGAYSNGGGPAHEPPLWSYLAIGGMAGLFSGMLGIGGGGIVVLGFSSLFGTPVLDGLPLALAVNVVNASSGVLAQLRTRQILWREVLRLVPTALVGIAVGVALAVKMPSGLLKILFAIFFIYMGTRLFARGRSMRP